MNGEESGLIGNGLSATMFTSTTGYIIGKKQDGENLQVYRGMAIWWLYHIVWYRLKMAMVVLGVVGKSR